MPVKDCTPFKQDEYHFKHESCNAHEKQTKPPRWKWKLAGAARLSVRRLAEINFLSVRVFVTGGFVVLEFILNHSEAL